LQGQQSLSIQVNIRHQRGFSLIELTLVMGVSVLVAGALIGMFQAHVQMLNQALKYKFLAQDAPFIGLLLTRTIGNAEDYRIYATGAIARTTNGTPVLTGTAVKLWMRQPNSTFRQVVVSFEPYNGHPGIYVYLTDLSTGIFPAAPNWELAGGQLTAATFDVTNPIAPGVLVATLNGTFNDQYIFSAEKK
jgi:prepilin-type N-terminal cleavage/methylation domain-containing protein